MKISGIVAILLWSLMSTGQEVHVSEGGGIVVLSVFAQKPYQLMSSEEKTPILSIRCNLKGKKDVHLVTFSPGTSLPEDDAESTAKGGDQTFNMTIGNAKQVTTWVPYGDTVTFAYFGKTEPERTRFIQTLLSSGTVSIEFKPFLTGVTTTSVFNLSELRDEMNKHPECAMK